jgi:hypothetical protein
MERICAQANVNRLGEGRVDSTTASFYWFTFSFYYYGSPALLAEQEVRKT